MKKEYIHPTTAIKMMESEEMLTGSEILKINEDGESGYGILQNEDANGAAMGKQGIWIYMED